MKALKLVVIAVQSGYLKKLTGQLTAMFGDRISIRAFQLGMLDKERIHPDEVIFSAIPNLDRLIKTAFPGTSGFIKAKRAVNLVNTGQIMALEKGRRILVVGDHEDVTLKIIRELEESRFDHIYIPFSPGMDLSAPVDCAVTTGEVELVPQGISHVINIGLRVISLDTMADINARFHLGLDPAQLMRQYILSLVHVSSKWPVSKKNKYISTWIGTRGDDLPNQDFGDFIAQSTAMKTFIRQARDLTPGDHPVHIDGDIGVGKRRGAIAIHNESGRKGEFFSINCTSEPAGLDRALFGWEEDTGIFPGLLETAKEGTVCIEEVENMPLDIQEKLARYLTDHCLVRTCGMETITAHARVVTTATLPLTRAFAQKKIRQSLYHHLSLHVCTMPSLAQRKTDFHLLIEKFLTHDLNRPDLTIEPGALEILKAHTWEGNVQEFYNVIFHLACLGETNITRQMLPFYIHRDTPPRPGSEAIIREIEAHGFLEEYLKILEIYARGKKKNESFGRAVVLRRLEAHGIKLSGQQLRLRQERLKDLGLIRVMKGRAGTTISRAGEAFLKEALPE